MSTPSLPDPTTILASQKELTDLVAKIRAMAKASAPAVNQSERIQKLRNSHSLFLHKSEFRVGDIVEWKAGLKNKKYPDYMEPGIVVDILESPLHDSAENAGSRYYNEPLDIQIAVINEESGFAIFHYDSRRFQHMKTESRA